MSCAFPGCTRPQWSGPDGTQSNFCGKTHRDAMNNYGGFPTATTNGRLCKNCQQRPVYVENGKAHDFCGKTCASNFDPCLQCAQRNKVMVDDRLSDFCSRTCLQNALKAGPRLFSLVADSKDHKEVQQQFIQGWLHSSNAPTVHRIWKIYGNQSLYSQFRAYKQSVEQRTGLANGNTRRRFHGTTRMCQLGNSDQEHSLCSNNTCRLCNIIKTSLRISHAQSNISFGRFGRGIYTSATSSKANDYVSEPGGSRFKAMLLTQVVMGKTKKLKFDHTTLTAPPAGFDSVVGEPDVSGSLNYDEAIVYTDDAIRPMFLIIYCPWMSHYLL